MSPEKTYALIGAIASLVTILAFLTGKESFPALFGNEGENVTTQSSFPPSNFEGAWSNEGDITAEARLELTIQQISSSIDGTLSYEEFTTNKYSKPCLISGNIDGGKAIITIITQKGENVGTATLEKDGDYIKFMAIENKEFFPAELLIWKQD